MADLVVMEARAEGRNLWAWCRTDGQAGFTDVTYTTADGLETAAPHPDLVTLGRHLFTVPADDYAAIPGPEAARGASVAVYVPLDATQDEITAAWDRRWPWVAPPEHIAVTEVGRWPRRCLLVEATTTNTTDPYQTGTRLP